LSAEVFSGRAGLGVAGLVQSRLYFVAALVALGAVGKSVAALVSGSRAILADALTCFASVAAVAAILYYYRVSSLPPDEDHPYGHARLRYGGVLASLAFYMFAAGAGAASVAAGLEGYRVEAGPGIPWLVLGTGFYAAAIALARGLDPVLRVYAGFTSSELLETLVSALGAVAGQYMGYVYDLLGAAVITGYILHEAYEAHCYLLRVFSDTAAPRRLYEALRRELRLRGLRLLRARLRMLDESRCAGDAVAAPPPGMPAEVADLLVDEVADQLARMGCDVVIHVAYAESHRSSPR
jgi:divalent metal cation (Fe/Co/Zn/Cd) transporter